MKLSHGTVDDLPQSAQDLGALSTDFQSTSEKLPLLSDLFMTICLGLSAGVPANCSDYSLVIWDILQELIRR